MGTANKNDQQSILRAPQAVVHQGKLGVTTSPVVSALQERETLTSAMRFGPFITLHLVVQLKLSLIKLRSVIKLAASLTRLQQLYLMTSFVIYGDFYSRVFNCIRVVQGCLGQLHCIGASNDVVATYFKWFNVKQQTHKQRKYIIMVAHMQDA